MAPSNTSATERCPLAMTTTKLSNPSNFLDSILVKKLDDINSEMARLSRLSLGKSPSHEFKSVQQELERVQQDVYCALRSQKDILERIERQEHGNFRRYLTFGRDQKVESLKRRLYDQVHETVRVDAKLNQLERVSNTILGCRRPSNRNLVLRSTSNSCVSNSGYFEEDDVEGQLQALEMEKLEIVDKLLCIRQKNISDGYIHQLQSQMAIHVSDVRACTSIAKQVQMCLTMYKQALHLMQTALSMVLAPEVTMTLKMFVIGPYLTSIEAGHLVEGASHVVQPQAQLRYRQYAPHLRNVRLPSFPQAITDFAKRARVNYDRKSALATEATRKLATAEKVLVMLHRIVISKLELILEWKEQVECDMESARHSQLEVEKKMEEVIQQMSAVGA